MVGYASPNPPYDLRSTPVSDASRRSCCRRDRADRRDRVCPPRLRECRAGLRRTSRHWRCRPRERHRPVPANWPTKPMVPPLAGVAGWPLIGFDTENSTGLGEVENAVAVHLGRPDVERAKQRVVERLGLFEVVGADHDMRKHISIPPSFSGRTDAIASRFVRWPEHPAALPVAGQCRRRCWRCTSRRWATAGKPRDPVAGRLQFGNPAREAVSSGKRGASTHPGILKRRPGQFLPLGCQPRHPAAGGRETTMSYLQDCHSSGRSYRPLHGRRLSDWRRQRCHDRARDRGRDEPVRLLEFGPHGAVDVRRP